MFSELLGRVTTDISTEKPAQAKFRDRVPATNDRLGIDARIFRTNSAGSRCLSFLHPTRIRLFLDRDVGRLFCHGGRLV